MKSGTCVSAGRVIAAGLAALMSCAASAAWGLKFEVWNGSAWVQSVSAPSGAAKVIKFRFGLYIDVDSPPQIVTADGIGTALALAQFTGSNQATNFAYEDRVQSVVRTISSGNPALLAVSGGTIGTTGVNSFGRQLFLAPIPFETYKEIYVGEIALSKDWSAREITLKNKTFGSGLNPGLTFYNSASPVNKQSAAPSDPSGRVDIDATIHVSGEDTCPADFNNDGIVDDLDFQRFAHDYQFVFCHSVEVHPACPVDLDKNRLMDDRDFEIFLYSYNRVLCP